MPPLPERSPHGVQANVSRTLSELAEAEPDAFSVVLDTTLPCASVTVMVIDPSAFIVCVVVSEEELEEDVALELELESEALVEEDENRLATFAPLTLEMDEDMGPFLFYETGGILAAQLLKAR